MKLSNLIIFISIVFGIYSLINSYVFIRGYQAMPKGGNLRLIFSVVVIPIMLSFIAGMILDRFNHSIFTKGILWVGNIYLALMLYLLLSILVIDIIRVANHFFHFLPGIITENYEKSKLITFFAVLGVSSLVILFGYINARNPKVHKLEWSVAKPAGVNKTIKIAAASDIHLGSMIGYNRFGEFVDSVNRMKPDIVLLAGDVFDHDITSVVNANVGELMQKIKAKYGVYAITGNHEYIGGADKAVNYLRANGINVLRDSAILIDNSFYLIGRDDRESTRFRGAPRKSLPDIMTGIDKTKPILLLDHQPFNLEQAVENGVDIQLSGHTHNGQLWPLNYITQKVYEVSMGYLKKGNTHIYVSPGYGTWGPPIRTGNKPEILEIDVKFE